MRGWSIISAVERAKEKKCLLNMSAKTISEHTAELLCEIQKVRPLSAEEIIRYAMEFNRMFQAKRLGHVIVALVVPGNQQEDFLVDAYLRDLKSADILEDPPGRFHSMILETRN
jgi:hypothetical protein